MTKQHKVPIKKKTERVFILLAESEIGLSFKGLEDEYIYRYPDEAPLLVTDLRNILREEKDQVLIREDDHTYRLTMKGWMMACVREMLEKRHPTTKANSNYR